MMVSSLVFGAGYCTEHKLGKRLPGQPSQYNSKYNLLLKIATITVLEKTVALLINASKQYKQIGNNAIHLSKVLCPFSKEQQ